MRTILKFFEDLFHLHPWIGVLILISVVALVVALRAARREGGDLKKFLEYVEALVVAILLALFIRAYVVEAFEIPSGSMLTTLLVGDHLLVSKYDYGVKLPLTDIELFDMDEPARGDVIVFEYPEDPDVDFIKRIIGMPGDTIEVRDKVVLVNGEALQEPYIRHTDPHMQPIRDNWGPQTVPEGHYFVMGDNRDSSRDSRYWGFVPRENIVGKAMFIYWSSHGTDFRFDRIGHWVE